MNSPCLASLYVGDSTAIETTLTNTSSVEWSLTKDGVAQDLTGFTDKGGTLTFTEEGTYTLKGVAKRGSYTDTCEKTVTVLPVVTLGFSLPEYAHTDEQTDVELRFENGRDGSVVWDLTKDGEAYPMPDGFNNEGGTLALTEPGDLCADSHLYGRCREGLQGVPDHHHPAGHLPEYQR